MDGVFDLSFKRRASATQINLRKSCQLRWFLKYVKKRKEPKTPALIKGSLVHSVVEMFYTKFNPKKSGINEQNYKTELYTEIYKIMEEEWEKPRDYFGKPQPSLEEDLIDICEGDEIAVAMEMADAKRCITNFMTTALMQMEELVEKYGDFNRAFYMSRPKFSEFEIGDDDFVGFVDQVFEKNGCVFVDDIKSGGSYYKNGYSQDYEMQLKLYAYYYYQKTGTMPDYGTIRFVKLGRECLYQFNKETLVDEIEEELKQFWENTTSKDVKDYPPNLDYKFCTCEYSKHKKSRGKGWCPHAEWCNENIPNLFPELIENE